MNIDELRMWLQERLPAHLLGAAPEIATYDDEVVIMLALAPDVVAGGDAALDRRQFDRRLIARMRDETRPLRVHIARELQSVLGRPVAWGMRVGDISALFTTRSTPVMTRLDRAEREVLDTLVGAGVADTRSAALSYVVRAFAIEHADWLAEARTAIMQVDQIRARLKLSARPGPPPTGAERSNEGQ